MKGESVVESLFGKLDEIIAVLRCFVAKLNEYVAFAGSHFHDVAFGVCTLRHLAVAAGYGEKDEGWDSQERCVTHTIVDFKRRRKIVEIL